MTWAWYSSGKRRAAGGTALDVSQGLAADVGGRARSNTSSTSRSMTCGVGLGGASAICWPRRDIDHHPACRPPAAGCRSRSCAPPRHTRRDDLKHALGARTDCTNLDALDHAWPPRGARHPGIDAIAQAAREVHLDGDGGLLHEPLQPAAAPRRRPFEMSIFILCACVCRTPRSSPYTRTTSSCRLVPVSTSRFSAASRHRRRPPGRRWRPDVVDALALVRSSRCA